MKRSVHAFVLLVVVTSLVTCAGPQVRIGTNPGRIEAAKHPLVLEPPIGPQVPRIDPIKVRSEANELATLAQSVPADIEQLAQGKLPKDFSDKLKRIEKLSKHLRSELTQ